MIACTNQRTLPHELLHTLGLYHPGNLYFDSQGVNTYDLNVRGNLIYGNSGGGNDLNKRQIEYIYNDRYEGGLINQETQFKVNNGKRQINYNMQGRASWLDF